MTDYALLLSTTEVETSTANVRFISLFETIEIGIEATRRNDLIIPFPLVRR